MILIPIVALSLGQAVSVLLSGLSREKVLWRLAVWLLFIFSILFTLTESGLSLKDAGYDRQAGIYEEIGDKVDHSTNVLTLDKNYGNGLMYHGKVAALEEAQWPVTYDLNFGESAGQNYKRGKELLDEIISERSPDYFIITSMEDFDQQTDLKDALNSGYAVVAQTPDYAIYDLRRSNK
jgi:hypothetical protein